LPDTTEVLQWHEEREHFPGEASRSPGSWVSQLALPAGA